MSLKSETTRTASLALSGAVAALALAAPLQAGARAPPALAAPPQDGPTVLFSTYDPSNTAVTNKIHFLPLDYRAPDASQSFDTAASVSTACGNVWCSYFVTTSVMTEFVAPN